MSRIARQGLWLLLSLLPAAVQAAPPSIEPYLTNIRDYQADVSVVQSNQAVLNSVNKDFARSYQLKQARVQYKEPAMIRVEGKRGFIRFVNICNGNKKSWSMGVLRGTRDVSASPSQKQTLQDFGILTPAQMADHTVRFVREENTPSGKLLVFELKYRAPTDKTRKLVWIDPVRKVMVKRQLFAQWDGSLKLQYVYDDFRKVDGIWIPHRLKVYNKKLQLGAVSQVTNVKLNQGISAALFAI